MEMNDYPPSTSSENFEKNLPDLLETKSLQTIQRCIAYNKYGKLCRAKIKNNELFCCSAHNPINKEIMNECFMCTEKINSAKELIYLKCKHAFHKDCYIEWLNFSTYDDPICMICRNELIIKEKPIKLNRTKVILINTNDERIKNINNLLNIHNSFFNLKEY